MTSLKTGIEILALGCWILALGYRLWLWDIGLGIPVLAWYNGSGMLALESRYWATVFEMTPGPVPGSVLHLPQTDARSQQWEKGNVALQSRPHVPIVLIRRGLRTICQQLGAQDDKEP